jgi:hypothetical protein
VALVTLARMSDTATQRPPLHTREQVTLGFDGDAALGRDALLVRTAAIRHDCRAAERVTDWELHYDKLPTHHSCVSRWLGLVDLVHRARRLTASGYTIRDVRPRLNPEHVPECTGAEIERGEVYIEYRGEAGFKESGTRYHAACAYELWRARRHA